MTAARKLAPLPVEAEPEHDPVWEAFQNAPIDPNPTPEHERLALAHWSTQEFVDGATVTQSIRDRAHLARKRPVRSR